ncbi:Werner syndrome ATP-dependent helicase [Grifola frondosa]|uniref:Werner syndrome ATP-dependent helicase n=1 Tax=Grifola frondosa TaxID=5627 RepID=A0A1C7MQU5_GRIFR|nr:Werner syndrome ATP-dependent helicase [Grifola frondosa]
MTDTHSSPPVSEATSPTVSQEPAVPPVPPRVYEHYSWSTKSPNTRLVYIRDIETADREISELRAEHVGFDLEWKPNYVKGGRENPVALVQLACKDKILLIQVSSMPRFPAKLRELLQNDQIVKAGVGIQHDCKKLYMDHAVDTRNCVDLSLLARCVDNPRWKGKYSSPIGLARLCETYEELTLQKGRTQISNWEAVLDARQQHSDAANDGHAGFILYCTLFCYGYLYRPSSAMVEWHPHNPYYDPGPPPPPRPPKVQDGAEGETNARRKGKGNRYRDSRQNAARPSHVSVNAPPFVPGIHTHAGTSSNHNAGFGAMGHRPFLQSLYIDSEGLPSVKKPQSRREKPARPRY